MGHKPRLPLSPANIVDEYEVHEHARRFYDSHVRDLRRHLAKAVESLEVLNRALQANADETGTELPQVVSLTEQERLWWIDCVDSLIAPIRDFEELIQPIAEDVGARPPGTQGRRSNGPEQTVAQRFKRMAEVLGSSVSVAEIQRALDQHVRDEVRDEDTLARALRRRTKKSRISP